MRFKRPGRLLAPYLILIVSAFSGLSFRDAHANLSLESSAESEDASGKRPLDLGLELGGNVLKASRGDGERRDHAWLFGTRLALLFRYRYLYVKPGVEFQYLHLDVNDEDSIDNAKLGSSQTTGGAPKGMFRTLAVGGTLGAVIPSSWIGTRVVQFGGFCEGYVMPRRGRLKLRALHVLYGAQPRDVLDSDELDRTIAERVPGLPEAQRTNLKDAIESDLRNIDVSYRMWTFTAVGFVTLQIGELAGRSVSRGIVATLVRPFRESAVSVGGGWIHLDLDVNVEVGNTLDDLIREDPSENVKKDKPIGVLRWGLPFGKQLGVDLEASAGPQNGVWIGRGELAFSVRF